MSANNTSQMKATGPCDSRIVSNIASHAHSCAFCEVHLPPFFPSDWSVTPPTHADSPNKYTLFGAEIDPTARTVALIGMVAAHVAEQISQNTNLNIQSYYRNADSMPDGPLWLQLDRLPHSSGDLEQAFIRCHPAADSSAYRLQIPRQ
jgi:hypothetical protein